MINKERGNFPNPEIEPEEINAFENKVRELVRNPKVDDRLPHVWTSEYRKGSTRITLDIPEPGYIFDEEEYPDPNNAITVSTWELLSVAPNGHTFFNRQEFNVDLGSNKKIFYNSERIHEYDADGNFVPSPLRKKASEEAEKGDYSFEIQLIMETVFLQNALKRQKFEEVMTLLHSLTPEDELQD